MCYLCFIKLKFKLRNARDVRLLFIALFSSPRTVPEMGSSQWTFVKEIEQTPFQMKKECLLYKLGLGVLRACITFLNWDKL